MAELVYLLCAISSVACAALLFRGHRRSGERLLLWSAIGFAGLALNNIALVIDLVLVPDADLSILRTSLALVGMLVMVGGFVWEAP
jgi:hypothetical protein